MKVFCCINVYKLYFFISKPLSFINTELLIRENLSNAELVEHMINSQLGVGFVNRHMGLPQNSFISDDAVTWLLNSVTTLNNRNEAVEILQVNMN